MKINADKTITDLVNEIIILDPSYAKDRNILYNGFKKQELKRLLEKIKRRKENEKK